MIAALARRMRDPLALPAPSARINTPRVVHNAARIVRMRPLTHDTFELVVECEHGSPEIFARAGQFATLKVDGVERPRAYSFAKDPRAEVSGTHTFYIRLVADGQMSRWLSAADRTGEAIKISGPFGRFGLDDSNDPMILVAGGSGISAIKALAEHACRARVTRDCYFFYGARRMKDLFCEAEIATVATGWHPRHRFEFTQVLSEEPLDSDWTGSRGFVTDTIREHCIDAAVVEAGRFKAYFCGPPAMIEAGTAMLRGRGVPDRDIHQDGFEDAGSPAPVIDNQKCVLCDECLLVRPVGSCIMEASDVDVGRDGGLLSYRIVTPARSSGLYYNTLVIDDRECIRCYACVEACPHGAISADFELVANTLRKRSPASGPSR